MPNPAHIFEVALLILVAFLIGATIGSLARRLTLPRARPATAPVVVTQLPPGPQLVTAPAIVPVDRNRPRSAAGRLAAAGAADEPAAATEAPVPVGEALPLPPAAAREDIPPPPTPAPSLGGLQASISMPAIVLPEFSTAPARQPAHVAGEPTSATDSPPPAFPPAQPHEADADEAPEVMPEPADEPVRAEDVPPIDETMHVIERYISAAIAADPLPTSKPIEAAKVEPVPVPSTVELSSTPAPPPLDAAPVAASMVAPAPAPEPELRPTEPVPATSPEAASAAEPTRAPDPLPEAEPTPEPDPAPEPVRPSDTALFDREAESAAMHAIESGNWSPRRRTPTRPVPAPEGTAELDTAMASARSAVAAATAAAAAAIVEAEVPASFETGSAAQLKSFIDETPTTPAPEGLQFDPAVEPATEAAAQPDAAKEAEARD